MASFILLKLLFLIMAELTKVYVSAKLHQIKSFNLELINHSTAICILDILNILSHSELQNNNSKFL